ncbi:MAG: phenylalanine--tRNA ligase subunit alpha [Oscillospiraceae bacterium]|nr:phenylalanine--tRNA ligase subunit alpha [Oscillospiraceae bacterium]
MKEKLEALRNASRALIDEALDMEALEALRVRYLGKKGELTALMKDMRSLSAEERPVIGALANEVRTALEQELESRKAALAQKLQELKLESETVDVTVPGEARCIGVEHPMNQVLHEIEDIFVSMGFTVLDGPEVERADYNFTRLNTPDNHPAREWTDTFYFDEESINLLRTQTSGMQIHAMEDKGVPLRVIIPGRVYRKDEVDATHSPMFHQIEGLVVDRGVTMADLKGTLNMLVRSLYGEKTVTRFRPHHFPFTEPSCEMDVQCHECGGRGCRVCKGEGWIEILGAGMVHPKVLAGCGVDPNEYSGWAFGMGLERLAMRRYSISDLRLIFENDVRFLEQFE